MPQIPRPIRLAFRRYFSGNAVARWICKAQAIILKDPQTRALLYSILHYGVLMNILTISLCFHVDVIKFVRLTAWAFYASGSFALICAVVEYFERHDVRTRSSRLVVSLCDPCVSGDLLGTGLEDDLCRSLASLRGLPGAPLPHPPRTAAPPPT